jgi:hypothetical protein
LERDADGAERIQRERNADVHGGSSGDVRDYAFDADADCWGSGVYGDGGQPDGGDV